jgi:hypothetical protein
MTDRIRDLLRAREWRPFTIYPLGGDAIHVSTRESVWVSPYGRLVYEKGPGQIAVFAPDQIAKVDLDSLTFREVQNQTG